MLNTELLKGGRLLIASCMYNNSGHARTGGCSLPSGVFVAVSILATILPSLRPFMHTSSSFAIGHSVSTVSHKGAFSRAYLYLRCLWFRVDHDLDDLAFLWFPLLTT
jgi:hypothetical protein